MSNAISFDWNIFCVTEGGYQKVVNQKYKPTTCPNDALHTIDDAKSTYRPYFSLSSLEDPTKRNGFPTVQGIDFTCAANTTTTYDLTFPYDIIIFNCLLLLDNDNKNDRLSVIATPNITVGAITSNISIGDTVIPISSAAITNLNKICKINFNDSDEYTIVSQDLYNSTITLSAPLTSNYTAGTIIRRNVYVVNNILLPDYQLQIGRLNPYPTVIYAGFILRFQYTNYDLLGSKTMNLLIEHY